MMKPELNNTLSYAMIAASVILAALITFAASGVV